MVFTTYSYNDEIDGDEDDPGEESNIKEEYVVSLPKIQEYLDRASVLTSKLNHLPSDIAQEINKFLRDKCICDWVFRDFKAANVPVRHEFELTDDRPIYYSARRMLHRDNLIIRE